MNAIVDVNVKAGHLAVRRYRNVSKKIYGDRYLRWLLGDRPECPVRENISVMCAQAIRGDVHAALTGAAINQKCDWALCPRCKED